MITLYNENDVRIMDIRIYEINDADMGESTITASVEFDRVMQFHPDWYVLVDGEKYKLGVTEPSGKRSTTQINVEYSLTFHSSREDLKRYTFMDFVEYGSGNPQPSQHTFSVQACTLAQFVSRFNTNLRYYLGSIWTMELSDDADPSIVANLTFDRASIWDVLLNVYSNYGVRWTIRNDNGIMSIIVGKDATELQTIFEYGNGNGLISVERTNPMERIVTRLRGKGGERNLPANYFHAATDAYPIGDPDTNAVLQGIYYNRLYPKCYRDYVRGYNSGESRTDESWAYQQGVADKIAGKPMNIVDFAKSDKEELWGISYGAIEDNDAIYPTLQGTTRDGVELDKVLAVSPIYVDAPDDGAASRQFTQVKGDKGSFQGRDIWLRFNRNQDGGISTVEGISNAKSATADSETFTLETSINTVRAKFLVTPTKVADRYASAFGVTDPVSPTLTTVVEMAADNWNFVERLQLINATTGAVVRTWSGDNQDFFDVEADDIPAGTYKFRSYIQWYKTTGTTPDKLLYTIDWQLYGCEYAVYDSELARQSYSDTFDIWIGNVWNTTKRDDETNEDYAFRVWSPLVSKDEMTVMFSDGLLAGEDYEFPIVGAVAEAENLEEIIKKAIHYDTSVTGSHWRLSLKKSDAEFEASGKYLPNSVVNAVAGNHFFFINILMPYDPYVYDAERRQQEYLEEQLSLLDVELPTFAVVPSSVFMASFAEAGDVKPGNKIRLFDKSLIGSSYTTVYIQSVTKRYTANKINPDWSLVVSDQIVVGGNPITLIDGKVEALSRQMYSSKQATRDAIEAMSQFYLRKDGLADTSFSPTDFRAPVTLRDRLLDYNFRQGDLGGYGFGVYTDPEGHRVVEADVLVGRMALRVNEIVVNQVDYVGGQRIYSAAAMTISRLEETESIWRCYFDNKQGSVQNLFLVGDLAFCQRFKGTEEGGYTTYWSKVTAIGSDYIELSKTDIMSAGSGTPAVGDNIIQLGNVSDKDRQSAIIMSSYGANSPSLRLYHGINGYSLNNKDVFGVEYDSVNQIPHFYNYGSMRLGARVDEEGGFIAYDHISKQLNIKAVVNFLPQSTGLEQMEAYQKLVQIAQGNIETWFHDDVTPAQTGAPTLTNYPVNSWEVVDYENHVGDIYYSDTGKGYRFKRSGNGWTWEIISDAELAKIMAEVQNLQYLKTALNQDTVIAGGLVLTSLIQLGYKDAQDVHHIMAGISGLGQNDRGIAAWFGGPMVDYEQNPTATDYAKSLFRFDGTGYFADGLFKWDKDKGVNLGNGAIKINYDGSVEFGGDIKIGGTGEETLDSLLTAVATLFSLWKIDEATGNLVTDRNVIIRKNLTVGGDTSTGGKGEDTGVSGTVTGIRVDATTILEPTNGIVDMSDVLANIDVDLSDYYTKQETTSEIAKAVDGLNLGQYAKASDLATHIGDSTIHITAAERAIWNNKWDYNEATIKAVKVNNAINADNAIKLLTPRTIWGQSFDGTGNVSGALTGVTDITASGNATIGGDVTINGNLIVKGDTTTGGTGSDAGTSGTVIGVVVNGQSYKDETNGMLDLSTLMNQYALTSAIPSLEGYAKIADVSAALTGYQPLITASNKLDYSLIANTPDLKSLAFKDSLSFGEIISKPTTISGYGITDAYTASTIDSKLSGYLPLSGGTLTGGLGVDTPLHIKSSNLSEVWINFTDTVGGYYIGSVKGVPSLYVGNHNQTIIHSGNYNSYAPTLTGTGASGTWEISISGNAATATNASNLGGIPSSRYLTLNTAYFTNNTNADTLTGVSFYINATGNGSGNSNFPTTYGKLFSWGETYAYTQLYADVLNNGLYFRTKATAFSGEAWKKIAFTDSNVASATKLATPRTIWGQSFDGTGNVSGALTEVTSITASGHAKVNSLKGQYICIECDNNGNTDGRGAEINTYNNAIYLQYNTPDNCIICYGGGNVGIGTTSPSAKLHVAGNAIITGDTATGSDIRFKDIIKDHRIALESIAQAPLFTFKWNDREDNTIHLGTSAQYWECVAPWLVKGTDFKVLDYSTLGVAIGISLANKTVNLEERVKILEKENEQLKKQIYGS